MIGHVSSDIVCPHSALHTYGQRIEWVLSIQHKTKAWLASELGISKQAMNYLINHASGPNPKYIYEIADLLQVNPNWLLTGREDLYVNPIHLKIPVFDLTSLTESHTPQANEHITASSQALSANCFAIRLTNSSMEPLFKNKTLLIFDPDRKLRNEDYVLVKIPNLSEPLFRQYILDGYKCILRTCNDRFDDLEIKDLQILGILVQSINEF